MKELKDLKLQELRTKAKALGLPIKFGVTKQELIEAITAHQERSTETVEKHQENSTQKNKTDFIEIPKDLKDLGLTPVRKLTTEEVRIDHSMSKGLKLVLPSHIQEEIEREGYEVFYPLNTPQHLQDAMRRGYEYVTDNEGNSIKIDAQKANEKGERIYHIAMKRPKALREKENELFNKRYQKKISRVRRGDTSALKGGQTQSDTSHIKFTYNDNNKI